MPVEDARFEQWLSFRKDLLCCDDVIHEIIVWNVDAARKQLLGVFTDEMPLIEDILGNGVCFRNSCRFVELYPKILRALEAGQIF